MKAKRFLTVIALISGLIAASACSDGFAGIEEPAGADETSAGFKSANIPTATILSGTIADVPIPNCVITGTVTDTEVAGLLFMREEEKMARDVYAYLYEKYKLPVFRNITKSENVHMSAVFRLITAFNIADNSSNNPGEFTDAHINELYQQLIKTGNISVVEALKVGVLIEQTDIADLKKELESIENNSIKTVYTNLLAGSNAHLKAFTWNLKVRGITVP